VIRYRLAQIHDDRAQWSTATTVETTPLTMRQLQILDCVREHLATHGYPPTHRQIAEQVGLSSSSSVHRQVSRLHALGHLHRGLRQVRALSPARPGQPGGSARLTVIDGGRP